MRFYANERLALLVDGPNLHFSARAIGLEVDWGLLQGFFSGQAMLVSSIYLTPLPQEHDDGFQPIRRMVDWLEYNGWRVVTRNKDTDVALAVMAMELIGKIDHFIIASGDSDFALLADALQRQGCRVTILSALASGQVSDELRRASTDFLDLETLRAHISRAPRAMKEAVSA